MKKTNHIKTALAGLALIVATSCGTNKFMTAPIDDDSAIITKEDKKRQRENFKGSYLGGRVAFDMSLVRFDYEKKNPLLGIPNDIETAVMLRAGGEVIYKNFIFQCKYPLTKITDAEFEKSTYTFTDEYVPGEPELHKKMRLIERPYESYKEGIHIGLGRKIPTKHKNEFFEIILGGYPFHETTNYVREYNGVIEYIDKTTNSVVRSEQPTQALYETVIIPNKGAKLYLQVGYGTQNWSIRLGVGGAIGKRELMKPSFVELGISVGGDIL